MARTPLFRQLMRSLQLARIAENSGMDAREVVQRDSEARRLSRRALIQGAGALAAGVTLEGCVTAPQRVGGARGDEPVIIIGAGIAGLTAAWRLRQAGVAVQLYDAQNRAGGRMYSLRGYFPDKQVAELGGELIDTSHKRLRALASELGLELEDLEADTRGLRGDTWFFGGEQREEESLIEHFLPIARRIREDLRSLSGKDITYRNPCGAEKLDRMTLAEWLEGCGTDGWVRQLLDVAYTTECGLSSQQQSSLNLLLVLDKATCACPDKPFPMYGDSDERFHVRGGNDLITQRLASSLVDVLELETRLEALRVSSDGRYECTLRRGSTSFTRSAREVVLALPFTLLRQVRLDVPLPEEKKRVIAQLKYGTQSKLMVGFRERVWRTKYQSSGATYTDLPYQTSWETSRCQCGTSGILTNFTGGGAGVALGQDKADDHAARFVEQLERIYPGVRAAREGMPAKRMCWPAFPFTLGAYSCYGPGDWTSLNGAAGEPVGGLHFAGEHCSQEAQGFMEGACETGEEAAWAILKVRRQQVPLRRAG